MFTLAREYVALKRDVRLPRIKKKNFFTSHTKGATQLLKTVINSCVMEGRAVKLEIQLLTHTFTFSEPQVVREILALIQNICFSLILLFFLAYAEFQTFNDAKNYRTDKQPTK